MFPFGNAIEKQVGFMSYFNFLQNKNLRPNKGQLGFTLAEGATHVDLPPTKNKRAFTLAEVLITLGIIGIVAAMTIPTLMQKYYEKQTVTKVIEIQSIVSQALKLVEEDYDTPEIWGLSAGYYTKEDGQKIGEIMKHGLKLALDCGVDDKEGKCVITQPYKHLNGTGQTQKYSTNGTYKVVLNNGASLWFGAANGRQIDFFFDTNGKQKPNVVGKDLFAVTYIFDKGLFADGGPDDDTPYETSCNTKSTGWGCTYYILKFKDMKYLK